MIVRNKVEFKSTFPDDSVEHEDGYFIQYPGKNVAEALAEMIAGLGYEIDPVESAGAAGWDFNVKVGKHWYTCQATLIEDYLAEFWNPSRSWWDRFMERPPAPGYLELLERVAGALVADPRFSDIRWATDEEATTGRGAPHPVQAE